jgi:hypothetical protein
MLHNTSHRVLFKRKYGFLNKLIPWVLGPFFGETPESYFAHHVGMHHPENNLSEDLSSTMKFQRDSFRDFMRYFLQFFIFVIKDLSFYLKRKGRKKLRQKFLSGESSWYVVVALLLVFNWQATIVVFIFPLVFTRFMMMAGNWGQHAFIDLLIRPRIVIATASPVLILITTSNALTMVTISGIICILLCIGRICQLILRKI